MGSRGLPFGFSLENITSCLSMSPLEPFIIMGCMDYYDGLYGSLSRLIVQMFSSVSLPLLLSNASLCLVCLFPFALLTCMSCPYLSIMCSFAFCLVQKERFAIFPHARSCHLDLPLCHLRDFPRAVAASSGAALITGVPPSPSPLVPPVLSRSSHSARSTSKPHAHAPVTQNLFSVTANRVTISDNQRRRKRHQILVLV